MLKGITALIMCVSCMAGAGEAAPVAFTSVYTGMDSCADACTDCGDGDIPQKCPGYGGYGVYESYSALQTSRRIEAVGGFEVDLTPLITCDYTGYGPKIEWRCAGGKPFAVVHRVSCYAGEADNDGRLDTKANFRGEFLIVRGLAGFEKLSVDIDARKDKEANETARKAADDFYRSKGVAAK